MYTQVLTPIENVCEILIYGNTTEAKNHLIICTEFGDANRELLLQVDLIRNGKKTPSEHELSEIRKLWDHYLMEEFELVDSGFSHFIDILNAF